VIAACARAFPVSDRDGTLLGVGLALAFTDAAAWAVNLAGTAARPLVLHAEALLHALGGRPAPESAAVPEADEAPVANVTPEVSEAPEGAEPPAQEA